jgi:hypothetical protein
VQQVPVDGLKPSEQRAFFQVRLGGNVTVAGDTKTLGDSLQRLL